MPAQRTGKGRITDFAATSKKGAGNAAKAAVEKSGSSRAPSPATTLDIPSATGPELDLNDAKFDAHYKEIVQRGTKKMVHGEMANKVDEILHMFDCNYDFGPTVGMTRLERWERADKMGLEPPTEVKDILLTKQGIGSARYREGIFSKRDV